MEIYASHQSTDVECKSRKGQYVNDSDYDLLLTSDCDVYDSETKKVVLKFRKNVIKETELAWKHTSHLAKASRGRGAAAGPIDPESVYWKKRDIYFQDKWAAKYMVKDKQNGGMKKSAMKVNNEVASNPIGYYGATKSMGLNMPCRLSHYTKTHMDDFRGAMPFFQEVSQQYKKLLPNKFYDQWNRARLNNFHIKETPFSTVTINRNFRTAIHQDAGDYGGYASLSVIEEGKYHGGYFVLPQYRIAVDLRHGDYLVCDVHQYHANTELFETPEDKEYNDTHPSSFRDNLEVGVLGLNNRFSRLSYVFYLREDIINCKNSYDKYYISLVGMEERQKRFEGTDFKLFPAVDGRMMSYDQAECVKMISYHNIRKTEQHLCKVGCFLSHLRMLEDIVLNDLSNVLIVEDDALQVNDLPDISHLPEDSITYFGGYIANKKITNREKFTIEHLEGLNVLEDKYRMLTTLAYFVPNAQIAKNIVDKLKSLKRWRAIDISLPEVLDKKYYWYPARFLEEPFKSTIRPTKSEFANEHFKLARCKV
tara:strand:+ start:724 stop:2331 length:1608 start_codon:yes stop_codon:yes gene_type:complete